MSKFNLLRNVRELNSKVSEFLNNISEASILFEKAVDIYLAEGMSAEFESKIREIGAYEARNDQLRRAIEARLYSNTLIPESRADVLELLEGLDDVINRFERQVKDFSIEAPAIPEEFHAMFKELCDAVNNCVEALIVSSRAFFMNTMEVNNSLHKVMFFERQGDIVCERLNRAIFSSDKLSLPEKTQMRKFADDIDAIANWAEDVADDLSIFTIKRLV